MDDYLNEKRLSPEKWGPLFAKVGITKPEHIQVVSGSHEKYTALSAAAEATDEENEILRRLLNIRLAENRNLDVEIENELTSAWLDGPYWLPIFKDKLGVKSPEALQHIGSESYDVLEEHIRQVWEKKVLRKFLRMEDEETALSLKRDEGIKKQEMKYQKAQETVQELKQLVNNQKSLHDADVEQKVNGIRDALQIPIDSWISEDTTLETLASQVESYINLGSEILKTRETWSDVKVLEDASGGRALQGILLSGNFDMRTGDRDYMLRAPEVFQFKGPNLDQCDTVECFTSKHQESQYTKSVQKLGFSATASVKAGHMGVGVEASASFSVNTEDESSQKHEEKEFYTSTVKYSFVPLASCYFKDNQLELSKEALKALREIETAVLSNKPPTTIQQLCEIFFQKFGSHANKGHLHFGGIYWWTSYTKSSTKTDTTETKKIQSEAISLSTSVGFGSTVGVGAEVSASHLKGKFQGTYDKTLVSTTCVKVTKTGGPEDASDLSQWKSGLLASNSTWRLIDRGSKLVPVWDILKMNHVKDFHDSDKLSQLMRQAYEEMVQYHSHIDTKHILDEEAIQMLARIESWNENMASSECLKHLKELVEMKHALARKSMSLETWPTVYLSQPPLQRYLKWVVDVAPGLKSPSGIKFMMRHILSPTDLDLVKVSTFPDMYYISRWVYKLDKGKAILPMDCRDFLSLKPYFDGALRQLQTAAIKEGAVMNQAKVTATASVAQVVCHLRNHLHKADQKYEDLFITTLLYPFKYNPDEKLFGCLFSITDLKFLSQELEEQGNVFFRNKGEGVMKVQAYLFHLTCVFYDNEVDLDIIESQINDHIKYLQKEIGSDLIDEVARVLSKCQNSSSSYDWQMLTSELSSLLHGAQPTQRKDGPQLNSILELKLDESDVPLGRSFKPQADIPKIVQELLHKLHLTKYYPQKLTRCDALQLQLETRQTTEQFVPLPHCILQRIMVYEYVTRAYLPHQGSTGEAFDEYVSQHSLQSDTSDSEDESEGVSPVHPMDALLALLLCSDNFLRPKLFTKLSTCQLAIPLLLPDPITQTQTQILIFPLWAMRSIVKGWQGKGHSSKQLHIVDHRAPVVSFVRFSGSTISKSKMLNDVISDSQHDFFFHYNSEGGSMPRLLVKGLVEVCWYLPSGKKSDPFPDAIAFTNLHGDAHHHDKQIAFLREISDMFCVLLSSEDLVNCHVLQELANAPNGMVLMFSDAAAEKASRKLLARTDIPRGKYDKIYLRKSGSNDAIVRNSIRVQIKKRMGIKSATLLPLSQCSEIACRLEIRIDEAESECLKAKKLAQATLEDILGDSTDAIKKEMLPLQGREMWQKWAKEDKEQHRHEKRGWKGIQEYTSQKEQDKRIIRQMQLKVAEHPTILMQSFLQTLQTHEGSTRNYFLEWLRLLLDGLSQRTLPTLWSDYQSKRRELQQLKDETGEGEHLTSLKHEEWELNQKLVFASIGLEHLFRELGQVYEAVTTQQLDTAHESLYSRLPQIAADLLIAGYPLELVDGDAGHVPMKWVNAVLDKVKQRLGDVRLFVLSVLGVQSSGKSTLLNTTFGLQFTVNAGRCTRGAFIQLLPLDDELKQEVGCDYVLVIDTEGLRAPEMSDPEQAQKHDNEMATFVIGLADITIINIFGEAPGDIDDILQTAVHAFLRMKTVRLHPRVQFVHQNVTSALASSLTKIGTYTFLKKLDTMTESAAIAEKCVQYTSFKHLIAFNEDTDVWYFPTLWKGDPPMASVNPGYSEKAHKLRLGLIEVLRSKGSQCSLSEFQTRIDNLWKAVLHENFIFSFKNAIEIAAYNKLDAQYVQWSWTLQKKMMEWEQETETTIESSNVNDLPSLENLNKDIERHALAIYEDLENEMNKYFNEKGGAIAKKKWQFQTKQRMEDLSKERQLQAKKQCETLIKTRQADAQIKGEKLTEAYRSNILDQVKRLVSGLGDEQLSEDDQKSLFEGKWTGWLQELTADMPKINLDYIDIEASIGSCFKEQYKPIYGLILKYSEANPIRNRKSLKMDVMQDTHIISQRWRGFAWLQPDDVVRAQIGTNQFLAKAKRSVDDNAQKVQNFKEAFVDQLLRELTESIRDFDKKENDFQFKPEYKAEIALVVCGYALHEFEAMMEKFRVENDPIEYLKRKKTTFLSTFKGLYSKCAQEKAAADNLCSLLSTPIEAAVIGSLAPTIVEDMKAASSSFHTKKSLKAKILRDLGEKHDFTLYMAYLSDPSQVIRDQIKLYTEEHCKGEGETSRLAQLAEVKISQIIHLITGQMIAEHYLKAETIEISDWLDELHTRVRGQLKLKREEMKEFLGIKTAQKFDYKFFTSELTEGIQKLQQDLNKKFQVSPATQMKSWTQRPYDLMYQSLIGCTEQCPFCKAQCELSNPKHVHVSKHSVELHRPGCLGGRYWVKSDTMVLETCNVNVASKAKHWYTEEVCKPYKDYQTYYPKWSITADLSLEAASYWKWFVAEYSDKLAKHFGRKEADIPKDWKAITWKKVKEDLEKTYDI